MSWLEEFPGNFAWSNAALVTKAMAPYGAVALAEVDEVCKKLSARQTEPHAWREEWCAMGRRLEQFAERAEAAGHRLSAGNFFLRRACTGSRASASSLRAMKSAGSARRRSSCSRPASSAAILRSSESRLPTKAAPRYPR